MKTLFSLIFIMIVFSSGCSTNQNVVIHSWAFEFVTWNHEVYKMTADVIPDSDLQEQLGIIKKYSTYESTKIPNLFSNKYEKGTKLFKIKNINTDESIAVSTKDGTIYKAIKQEGFGVNVH